MKRDVVIVTNFQEYNPGYSLVNVVRDQITMLLRNGHQVKLLVSENYNGEDYGGFKNIKKVVTFAHLKDYRTMEHMTPDHQEVAGKFADVLRKEIKDGDIVFTHDLVFTGWNLPYASGIMTVAKEETKDSLTRWLHWIHSIPSLNADWWNMKLYNRHHKIIFPNATERVRVAEQYKSSPSEVRHIHHIKDLRTWYDFDQTTKDFIDAYPGVMQSDIVQIYPASVDRLETKRVKEVILIFSKLKRMGYSVCLVILNQWATGTQQKQNIEHYYKIARRNGLTDREVIFSSDFRPEYEIGVSQRMVRELFQCSNLFIFPTREESFGLVLPEAAHAGVMCVLNKSLNMMHEIGGLRTIYADFGSFHNNFNPPNEDSYMIGLAQIISGRMRDDEALRMKTFVRQRYNMDYLYSRQYLPVMGESATWPI